MIGEPKAAMCIKHNIIRAAQDAAEIAGFVKDFDRAGIDIDPLNPATGIIIGNAVRRAHAVRFIPVKAAIIGAVELPIRPQRQAIGATARPRHNVFAAIWPNACDLPIGNFRQDDAPIRHGDWAFWKGKTFCNNIHDHILPLALGARLTGSPPSAKPLLAPRPIAGHGGLMTIKNLFATPFYEGQIENADLVEELKCSCRALARDDVAGQNWSKEHGYTGYTSYASLNDLPVRDPVFEDLRRILDKHVRTFAEACQFDLGRKPKLDSLWVNILKPGGMHSGHIHPHSIISGTCYIAVPKGSGALKLEDPRLARMMAAPARKPDAPEALQPFVYAEPKVGTIFLWESWLTHEVMPSKAKSDRISISFNYR
jgi:uncharacterized protein (TIGR02466 family)